MNKFILSLFIAFSLTLALVSSVYTCTGPSPDFRIMALEADAVFIAKASKVEIAPIAHIFWEGNKGKNLTLVFERGQKVFFEIGEISKAVTDIETSMLFSRSRICTRYPFGSVGVDLIVFAFKASTANNDMPIKKLSKKQQLKGEALKAEANRVNKDLPSLEFVGLPLDYFDEKELKIIKDFAKSAKRN
jgi:hypothetical protein